MQYWSDNFSHKTRSFIKRAASIMAVFFAIISFFFAADLFFRMAAGSMEKRLPASFNEGMAEILAAAFSLLVLFIAGAAVYFIKNKRKSEAASANEARLSALVDISLMNDASVPELVEFSLKKLIELLKSEFGYIALMNGQEGTVALHTFVNAKVKGLSTRYTQRVFAMNDEGPWTEFMQGRKSVIVNDCKITNPFGASLPGSHPSIFRYIGVPLYENGSIVAVTGMANKSENYNDIDVLQVSLLIDGIWRVILGRKMNDEIQKLAYYDPLTGLPNRTLLIKTLGTALEQLDNGGSGGALLFIDTDNFKIINDTFGHTCGDKLLVGIGRRIKGNTPGGHTVARLGGDEFVVLYKNVRDREEVQNYTAALLKAFEKPINAGANDFFVTLSIGIVLFPQDGTDLDELLKSADMAMYSSKARGKNTFSFYEQSMNDAVIQKIVMESSLRHALKNNEFILHYQPQINLITGRITGFEALIRWNRPGSGLIYPGSFISMTEESGMIVPIGEWVLRTACSFAKELNTRGYGDYYMSVNVSSVQLMHEGFVGKVLEVLAETGLPAQYLELEITESVLMESFDKGIFTLERLRESGIKISLDDFGSRYSSLNYLKRLPISTLKIDKSFIDDIHEQGRCRTLTGSIVALAHKMGLKIIAEGVETMEQLQYLKHHHCDMIQGYLVGKPVSGDEIGSFILEWKEEKIFIP